MSFAELDLGQSKKILEDVKRLTGNEWAEEYAYLSVESSVLSGRWVSRPYQAEIINSATSDPECDRVVWKKSSRVGYTKCLLHVAGYFIEHKPSGILIVQPTVEDAEGFSKEELANYIRDVPVLSSLISDVKTKDGTNSILHKQYPGGVLSLIGANSPRGFRRITRKAVLFDETSAYPNSAGAEGDPVQLGMKRATGFIDKKIFMGSSPKIKDFCSISKYFKDTDQRYFFLPCPHCGYRQFLKWTNFKIPDDDPKQAYFECEKEKCKIEHHHKFDMMEKGGWVPTAVPKNPKWRGYHIWTAYSYEVDCTWADIATAYLEAKGHDRESMQTFVNTWLGEEFDDKVYLDESAQETQKRAEAYELNTAPAGVAFAVHGIDVQGNRIAIKTVGFGHDDEQWIINYEEIYGNTSQPEVWLRLDEKIKSPIKHEKYGEIYASAAAIDTGHETHAVYQFVRERKGRNIIAIKGSSQRNKPILMRATAQDVNYRGQIMKKGVYLYPVGTDTAKAYIYSKLNIKQGESGYVHFSAQLSLDYFVGVQSEKRTVKWKRGKLVTEWEKISSNVRNEPLDCWVYALVAREFVQRNYPKGMAAAMIFKSLDKKLEKSTETEKSKKSENIRNDVVDNTKAAAKVIPQPKKGGGYATNY